MKAFWIFTILCLSPLAFARWGAPEEAEVITYKNNNYIKVNEDGSFETKVEIEYELAKENAVQEGSHYQLPYSPDTEKITILKASVTNSDGTKDLDLKAYAEDKAVMGSSDGSDNTRVASIIFPNVRVGSRVSLTYLFTKREPTVPSYFEFGFRSIGQSALVKSLEVEVESPFPLYASISDPTNSLEKKVESQGKGQVWKISLKKPLYRTIEDEEDAFMSPSQETFIFLSSQKTWSEFGAQVTELYERVATEALPKSFEALVAEAKKQKTAVDQINVLTEQLRKKVRYFRRWENSLSAFAPHSLKEIEESGYADCKDFSILVTAMLRKLGFDAKVAIIESSHRSVIPDEKLPQLSYFNHAIVRASREGKTYWVDGTSTTSYAQGIWLELADRMTLILDGANTRLVKTPDTSIMNTTWIEKKRVLYHPTQNTTRVEFDIKATGYAAMEFVGAENIMAKESIDRRILEGLDIDQNFVRWKVNPYSLTSNIYHDVRLGGWTDVQSLFQKTSVGKGYYINNGKAVRSLLREPVEDRETDLFLERPKTLGRYEDTIVGAKLVGKPISCRVKSRWFEGERKVDAHGGAVRLIDEVRIKENFIPIAELRSAEFRAFKNRLGGCFEKLLIELAPAAE